MNSSDKISMSLRDFTNKIRDSDCTVEEKLEIFERASFPFVRLLYSLAFDDTISIIHYDTNSKNIVAFKDKRAAFDIFNPKTYYIGMASDGKSLFRNTGNEYTYSVFRDWDRPYLKTFLSGPKVFADCSNYSFEGRLMNFMAGAEKEPKSTKLWIERWAQSEEVVAEKKGGRDILYHALPRFIKSVKGSGKYKRFEKRLYSLVVALCGKSSQEQYAMLRAAPTTRIFLDALKSRSHLPTAYGIYLMNTMRACGYSLKNVSEFIIHPNIAPPHLQEMIVFYWIQLLMPWDGEDSEPSVKYNSSASHSTSTSTR